MKFFMISDFHLGRGVDIDKAKGQLVNLCGIIRKNSSPKEMILFIIMGDIINASDTSAFMDAQICLDCIREELRERTVRFEFVPGNHDLPKGDISPFDRFIAEYGVTCPFGTRAAYSNLYEGVNFIFADSNLTRDHRMPGKLDLDAIRLETKECVNLLFCHHGFTHSFGDDHNIVENGDAVLTELRSMGVGFVFHGHTHRADATVTENDIIEIGCGTIFKDISDMDGIQNQFSVGYISDGDVVKVERFVISKDGGNVFPREMLFPEEKIFADPAGIEKQPYDAVPDYIRRKVLPHASATTDAQVSFFVKDQRILLQDALMEREKILFLSDAGQGKSIEMENLAHELANTLYFPYLYRLRDYAGCAIEDILPERYNKIPPYYLVLLFDGYDELTAEERRQFEKQLNSYVRNHAGIHIVISSRSNFCKSERNNESDTFQGFYVYDLCELSGDDISAYLRMQGIDEESFYLAAKTAGISGMVKNAFYLTKVSALYKKNGVLPKKSVLMDHLIEACFDTDDKKYAVDLESDYHDLMEFLMKASFAMQLMQKSKFDDRTEYQELFSREQRDLAKHSGLLARQGDSWQFVHNNFREYLAAKHLSGLSKGEVIGYIFNGEAVNPSWVNTLGYLTGMELSWDLVEWIGAHAPNALVRFESDRVDEMMRYSVFTSIFRYYEERRLWFRDELCNAEELARFSESEDALVFLLDKISHPVHKISQYTAVNILRHYSRLYGRQNEVRECLMDCCRKYPETENGVCRVAVFAIGQLKLGSPDITRQLVALFDQSDDDYVRLGMYEYLMEVKEYNEHVAFFLDGIPFIRYQYHRQEGRVGNESYWLVKGLKAMSTAESVAAVLNRLASEERVSFYSRDEVFAELSRKASRLYLKGEERLYEVMLSCCMKALRGYNHNMVRECVTFFVDTDTLESGTVALAKSMGDEINSISDILYLKPEAFSYILAAYSENRFDDHEAFRWLAMRFADDLLYEQCAKVLMERGGIQLPEREPVIDYEAERKKGLQRYFCALFDKDEAKSLLTELMDAVGDPDLLVKDLFDVFPDIPWYSPIDSLKITIYHGADSDSRVADFFSEVDFDALTVLECRRLLSEKAEIVFLAQQKERIKEIIGDWLDQDILHKEVGYTSRQAGISARVRALIFLSQYFDLSMSEDKMLDMTLVPDYFFTEFEGGHKYEYLRKHVPLEKLRARIEENLEIDDLDSVLLRDHITFCRDMMWEAAAAKALMLCQDETAQIGDRSVALEYLYKYYGADYVVKKLLPDATGDFLLEIAKICKEIPVEDLRHAMEAEYAKTHARKWMPHLITLGSETAIQAYVDMVTENLRIPERDVNPDSATYAVSSIQNPAFLPQLGKLVEVLFDPRFEDQKFFGLQNSLSKAFVGCGRTDPDAAMAMIGECQAKLKEVESAVWFCNHVMEEIKQNKRKDSDRPWGIEEVKVLLQA